MNQLARIPQTLTGCSGLGRNTVKRTRQRWIEPPLITLALLVAFGAGCSRKAQDRDQEPVQNVSEPTLAQVVEYGTASIEAFEELLLEAFTTQDHETYRRLHCWDKLPAKMRSALEGAVRTEALKVFAFIPERVDVEPMTRKEVEQAEAARWNITPTHWVIVQGPAPNQFKHWEIGEYEGRFYFANRLP